jgi:hypothetical protein
MGPPEAGNAGPTCKCSPCGVEGADFASRLLDDLRKSITYCVTTSAVKNLMRHVHSVFMARLALTAGLNEWLVRQAMHVQR